MYGRGNNISAKINDRLTDPFTPEVWGRQGDVLSSNIFKIFLNDFSNILEKIERDDSVNLSGKKITSLLLYADDLVLISNNAEGLQHRLEILHQYCKDWCLKVNIKKTKVVIFNKTIRLITENFKLGSEVIECVNRYKYLGIMLSASGNFKKLDMYYILKR